MSVLQYDTASSQPGSVLPLSGDFAGYISGLFDNYHAIVEARPHALVLPIFTRLPLPGELDNLIQVAFDVENGDLTPEQIRQALQAAWDAHIPCPVVYGNRDTWSQPGGLTEQLGGLERNVQYQEWLANPDGDPDNVPPGVAAKQYLFGRDYDTTIVLDPTKFYNLARPQPAPEPPGDTVSITAYETADRRVGLAVETSSGEVLHIEQQGPSGIAGQDADWWRDKEGQPNWLSLGVPGK